MVVKSADYLSVADEQIKDIVPIKTIVNDKVFTKRANDLRARKRGTGRR